jgi:phosphonoacetate hydrolase
LPAPSTTPFSVNGRHYAPPPCPLVVVCIDGCAEGYLDAALLRDRMPHLARLLRRGYRGLARGALPSFTNTNNASIVTGLPPAAHGMSGNFFLDPDSDEEVMMNSSRFLRAETILAAAARAGRRVAFVTAKDKLREIFSQGIVAEGEPGIAFSAEKADGASREVHGIDGVEALVGVGCPEIYSADASVFVLQAGAALLERGLADFLYLSTTDYVQHKFAPDEEEALDFYARLDQELGRIAELGAQIGLTADHGMNAKQTADGGPNVIYLEEVLERAGEKGRVILPITDPYVLHHGALGSFAVVHLEDLSTLGRVRDLLAGLDGVIEVYDREAAAHKLELPADRIGDLVVLSGRDVVLGRRPEHHDLAAVQGGLRSHGGRYEEMVPFLFSFPLEPSYAQRAAGDPRNFDIFDFAVNGSAS